jgi:hypothetical protein
MKPYNGNSHQRQLFFVPRNLFGQKSSGPEATGSAPPCMSKAIS